jgi:BlaI family penicillinase repressor
MDELTLGSRELDVMALLWEHGSGTVGEVRDRLDAPLAYTTVLTILRNLESKGLLRREAEGRGHRYFPKVAQRTAQRSALRHLLDGFFGGSPESLLARLVDDHEVDADELRAMAARLSKSDSKKRREP